MKIAWRTMAGIGVFVIPFAVVYGVLSGEESGTILLVGVPLSMLLLAGFLFSAARRSPSLPEDRTNGVATDNDEIGVFPSASIWPVVLGLGMTLTAFGFAYSAWLALPGLGVLVLALGGLVVESGRVR